MGKIFLASLICLGIMISGFAANETNKNSAQKVIKLSRVSAESVPEWAKGIKSLFKIDAGEYICYLDGAAYLAGITTKDGKRVLGQSCSWMMQYKENGKLYNYQEFIGIPKVKVLRNDDILSIIIPPQKGKLLDWERKITIKGKEINIEFLFRFTESFKARAQKTEHLSIFTRLALPGFVQGKQTQKNVFFKNENFTWDISFDPDSEQDRKVWWFDQKAKELRVSPENVYDLRKSPNESFKIRISLQPL